MGSTRHPDLERVQAALRREPGAIEWLTRQMAIVPRLIGRLARNRGWPTHEIDDAANDAVLTALRRLDSYHGLVSFVGWLHRICLLTLRGLVRRRWRQQAEPLDFEVADATLDPRATAADREELQRVLRHIDAIGGVEAELLRLRFLEQMDFADIAAAQGIPLATVRTRYYRAMKRVLGRLETDTSPDAEP